MASEEILMSNSHDIEIAFDEVSKDYYAIWEPPVAIGSGKTKLEALRDLQEAAHFGIASLLGSRHEKVPQPAGEKEENKTENNDKIKEKARKIVALLPKKNCGKCGFTSCGEFAMAVAQGNASPFGCHKQPSSGDTISEITGIMAHKQEGSPDYSLRFPHFGIPDKRHHSDAGGRGGFVHRAHHGKHGHGKAEGKCRVDK
jgi:predicted RNase H-like HicB family nuclease